MQTRAAADVFGDDEEVLSDDEIAILRCDRMVAVRKKR